DRLVQILTLATRHAVAAIYPARFWADAGGLMSYGSRFTDQLQQAGIYTGPVRQREKTPRIPDLPRPRFDFDLDLPTGRLFGVDVSPTLLARADELIE